MTRDTSPASWEANANLDADVLIRWATDICRAETPSQEALRRAEVLAQIASAHYLRQIAAAFAPRVTIREQPFETS